ncbi:alkene reductase [Siculibacillus lacustris]|uniref:Alkene reductase n=1 Tax=Siculibacillus lacustris TaxID=1549641 RepID=A0A4Q9VL02_9HYPH|nr:alkene reductase [Siculibacillus lacustris]TBW35217.1 alkene reductase [Siculibacillus lacustris]
MSELFSPLVVGDLTLPNRIIMAPLTRCRAAPGRVPTELNAEYYAQRADAGLILSEATAVTPQGVGYPDTPGLWTEAQVEGWKLVTAAVHAKGGRIFAQLWHVGRISDPLYLHGEVPVAPSAVQPAGHVNLVRPMKDFVTPRALELDEIPGVIAAYVEGARNAKLAGFDGVEIHAANGYLIDQFLQDKTNKRTDIYGGSIENRARLLLEVTDAVIAVWGKGRVGVHLAPRGDSNDAGDSNPAPLFTHVASELGKRGIAFIFTREYEGPDSLTPAMKAAFGGVVIANEKFTKASAEAAIAAGRADAVSWGKSYIANPDLVTRLRLDAPLQEIDFSTAYGIGGIGPKGYTDYPALTTVA